MVRKAAQEVVTEADVAKDVFAGDISSISEIYTDKDGTPLGLIARLARIMGSLPEVKPEGENAYFKYKFIRDKQVLGLLRPRLARQLIIINPEIVDEREPIAMKTAKGGDSLMTRVTVTWRVKCGISGESFTGQSVGYGDDSGDKGANKAFTAALKNYLIKLFEIGGEPDIEEDEGTDRRAKARETGTTRVTEAKVEAVKVEGVERGGRAAKSTEAQISRVGQYVRDLSMDAPTFAAFLKRKFDIQLDFGEDPWIDVKNCLESMSGTTIGQVVADLDELLTAAFAPKESENADSDEV